MKKFLFTIALIIAGTSTANAQLGFSAAYVHQTNVARVGDTSREAVYNGGSAGMEFKIPLVEGISLLPGANLSFLLSGTDEISLFSLPYKGQYKEVNVNIPIEIRYDFDIASDTDFFVYAGPSISYGLSSKFSYESLLSGKITVDMYGDKYNRINLGADFGFGFVVFDNIQGKIGYNLGLLDRDKEEDVKLKTSFLSLGLAYLF